MFGIHICKMRIIIGILEKIQSYDSCWSTLCFPFLSLISLISKAFHPTNFFYDLLLTFHVSLLRHKSPGHFVLPFLLLLSPKKQFLGFCSLSSQRADECTKVQRQRYYENLGGEEQETLLHKIYLTTFFLILPFSFFISSSIPPLSSEFMPATLLFSTLNWAVKKLKNQVNPII